MKLSLHQSHLVSAFLVLCLHAAACASDSAQRSHALSHDASAADATPDDGGGWLPPRDDAGTSQSRIHDAGAGMDASPRDATDALTRARTSIPVTFRTMTTPARSIPA
jgi:hypothetical protein